MNSNKNNLSAEGSDNKHGRIGKSAAVRTVGGYYHTPVLLKQVIEALDIKLNEWYVDCTLGGGGHTQKILESGGLVLGIDQDQDAINFTSAKLKNYITNKKLVIKQANFSNLKNIIENQKIIPSGILFDLGVSSYQLTGNNRGFSFQSNENLDMRMDRTNQTVTARNLINVLYEKELQKLIETYGEDPLAHDIARAIVIARKRKPIETTGELAVIVKKVYDRRYSKKSRLNPATRTFQALRIAVNDELNVLKQTLSDSISLLKPKARLVIISFHGLEDKIIKNQFASWEEGKLGKNLNEDPILPTQTEINSNPKSRSAKLRIFEKNE